MNVFISWSGERSRLVAELLSEWLQCVLQAVNPWMSSKDIDRGSLWFSEITDVLANTNIGIVCLTDENKNKPWILFESGALAKGLSSSRVCTFLIDLKPTDLQNPLAQFNHTEPSKAGLSNLITTINRTLGDKGLKDQILDKVFETYYPEFEKKFATVIAGTPVKKEKEARKEPDLLLEMLESIRSMEKRMYMADERLMMTQELHNKQLLELENRLRRNMERERVKRYYEGIENLSDEERKKLNNIIVHEKKI